MQRVLALLVAVGCWIAPVAIIVHAQSPDTVFLEDLTWTELRDLVNAGTTTMIIPTGGTEQNGPHMVLGKHNFLVKHKAGEIAKRLGHTLVAPVMSYVPEGDVNPPTGHMRFTGTITTPQDVFAKVLEFAARSFKQHGFRDIALLGDSGGNQAAQKLVAEALNKEWAATPVRVHHLTDYYPGPGDDWLKTQGESDEDRRLHASIHDTASLLLLNPAMLRCNKLRQGSRRRQRRDGNPARSTVRVRPENRGHADRSSRAADHKPSREQQKVRVHCKITTTRTAETAESRLNGVTAVTQSLIAVGLNRKDEHYQLARSGSRKPGRSCGHSRLTDHPGRHATLILDDGGLQRIEKCAAQLFGEREQHGLSTRYRSVPSGNRNRRPAIGSTRCSMPMDDASRQKNRPPGFSTRHMPVSMAANC